MAISMTEIADRLAIMETLARYCHGVDRCDADTLAQAFWPEATLDYGAYKGPAGPFFPALINALREMRCTSHFISNVMITVQGERAKVETYCRAVHLLPGPDGEVEMDVGGRYIDVMECRDTQWRILTRLYVLDWNRNGPATAIWDQGMYAQLTNRGARWPNDPFNAVQL